MVPALSACRSKPSVRPAAVCAFRGRSSACRSAPASPRAFATNSRVISRCAAWPARPTLRRRFCACRAERHAGSRSPSIALGRSGTTAAIAARRSTPASSGTRSCPGAIVVEAPHAPRLDHIFVLGLYAPVRRKDGVPNFLYLLETINGRAYPATERLTYERGRTVRWAVVNESAFLHPMHLHGFYFRMNRPDAYDEVTHPFFPGESGELAWTADRAGRLDVSLPYRRPTSRAMRRYATC